MLIFLNFLDELIKQQGNKPAEIKAKKQVKILFFITGISFYANPRFQSLIYKFVEMKRNQFNLIFLTFE